MGGDIRTLAEICGVLLGLYALHLFVVLVHEAGHAIMAWLVGLDCTRIAVGPIVWTRPKGAQIHFRFADMLNGVVIAQFRQFPDRNAAWQSFVFILAGPTASAALALAAAAFTGVSGVGSAVAAMAMLDSALVALITLLPLHFRDDRTSDGLKLCFILFSPARRRRLILYLSVLARIRALKEHWRCREFMPVVRILDELSECALESLAPAEKARFFTAVARMRECALNGMADSPAVDLEFVAA